MEGGEIGGKARRGGTSASSSHAGARPSAAHAFPRWLIIIFFAGRAGGRAGRGGGKRKRRVCVCVCVLGFDIDICFFKMHASVRKLNRREEGQ